MFFHIIICNQTLTLNPKLSPIFNSQNLLL